MVSKRLLQHTVLAGPEGQPGALHRFWRRSAAALLAATLVGALAAGGGRSAPALASATSTFSVAAGGDDGSCEKGDAGYPPAGGTQVSCFPTTSDYLVRRSGLAGYKPVTVGLLRFDTSSLPDDAQITSASLRLFVNAIQNGNGRSLEAEWYSPSNWPIDSPDWTLTDSGSADPGTPLSSLQLNQYNTLALQNPSNINLTGFTGFRLHVSGSADTPTAENLVQFAGFERGAGTSAQLQATYTTSSGFTANEFVNTTAGPSPSRCSPACAYDPAKAFGSFAAACAAASAGDTVATNGGTYPAQQVTRANCNPSSPITFVPVPGATVTLTSRLVLGADGSTSAPNNLIFDGAGGTFNVTGVNIGYGGTPADGDQIRNLHISALDTGLNNGSALVFVRDARNVTIAGNDIGPGCCNSDALGIEVRSMNDPNPQNVTIVDNVIHDVYDTCTETPSYLGTCTGRGYGDDRNGGYFHIDGMQFFGGDNLDIERNAIYLQGDHKQGIFLYPSNGGTFSNITVAGNMLSDTSDNTLSISGDASTAGLYTGYLRFYYNTVQGTFRISDRQIAPGTPVVITGNIFDNQAGNTNNGGCTMLYSDNSPLVPTWNANLQAQILCPGDRGMGRAAFVRPSWPGGALKNSTGDPDLHLSGPQMAINGAEGAVCGVTLIRDIDEQTRPIGGTCDIGADESGTPTAAVLSAAGARRVGAAVLVHWRTVGELGVVGFNVYRSAGTHRARLNRALIPAAGAAAGRAYAFRDRKPGSHMSRYWLQVVRTRGGSRWYGPLGRG